MIQYQDSEVPGNHHWELDLQDASFKEPRQVHLYMCRQRFCDANSISVNEPLDQNETITYSLPKLRYL